MTRIKPGQDPEARAWNVIQTDNFNRDIIPDSYKVRYLTYDQATRVCDILRENTSNQSANWYEVVHNDYRLKRGIEDCI